MQTAIPQPDVPITDPSFRINTSWYRSLVAALNRAFASSVFGRTGDVVAVAGDYTSALIPGTTTNDNAPAGYIGETKQEVVLAGAAVALTTATPADLDSITLGAGDWLVWTDAYFTGDATTTVDRVLVSLSDTTATVDPLAASSVILSGATPFNLGTPYAALGPIRKSLAAPDTFYAVAFADFAVNSCSVYGRIIALRIR